MWRKFLMAMVLVTVCTAVAAGIVFASPSPQAAQSKVPVTGTADVIQGEDSSQIRVKAQSTDGNNWILEVALDPVGVVQGSGNSLILNLSGTYTLGLNNDPISTGNVTGQLTQRRGLSLTMTNPSNSVSLQAALSVDANGNVTGEMYGTMPALPSAASGGAASDSGASTAAAPVISHTYWYISRTAAIIAYLLLFINVCLGLGMRSRVIDKVLARWRVFDLHQFTGLMAMGFIFLHVLSLLGDQYFKFGVKQLLVPFANPYRPIWVALGVFSFYTAIVVVGSFYVRNRIGIKTWRAIHYATFILFSVVMLHAIKAGTDTPTFWGTWIYVITGTITFLLFLWRFWGTGANPQPASKGEAARRRSIGMLDTVGIPRDDD